MRPLTHSTLPRSIGSLRGSSEFRKTLGPNFCENFIKEKLHIFDRELIELGPTRYYVV